MSGAVVIILTPPPNPEANGSDNTVYFLDQTPDGNDLQGIFDAITEAVEESQ